MLTSDGFVRERILSPCIPSCEIPHLFISVLLRRYIPQKERIMCTPGGMWGHHLNSAGLTSSFGVKTEAERKEGDYLLLFTYATEALSSMSYLHVICIMQKRTCAGEGAGCVLGWNKSMTNGDLLLSLIHI